MRYRQSLLPTYKEDPADTEAVSHKLMIRAGMIRQLAAGLYVLLPLGLRVLDKVNAILREEMNAIGAQEMSMPILHPAEIWQQTGRWDAISACARSAGYRGFTATNARSPNTVTAECFSPETRRTCTRPWAARA